MCVIILCVRQSRSGIDEGLFESLLQTMEYVGVNDWKLKLIAIGLGCDGCSANMGGT